MSKTIRFQMIADDRFYDNIAQAITDLKTKVDAELQKINVINECSGICDFIRFSDNGCQYRVDYKITKRKDFTYKQLFTLVNSVKAPFYSIN